MQFSSSNVPCLADRVFITIDNIFITINNPGSQLYSVELSLNTSRAALF